MDSFDSDVGTPTSSVNTPSARGTNRLVIVSLQLPVRMKRVPPPMPPQGSAGLPSPQGAGGASGTARDRLPAGGNAPPAGWDFEWDEDALVAQIKDCMSLGLRVVHVGCLPSVVEPEEQDAVGSYLTRTFGCVPLFLDAAPYARFYQAFCKRYMWPLLHYMLPLTSESAAGGSMRFERAAWQAYVACNKRFADKVVEVINPESDYVWIHDYHLMVAPTFLRKKFNHVRLGFFLHSVFPSSEVYRTCVVREEILRAVLNSDLIGFHTFDYARHFLSCCSRMLGLEFESRRGYIGLDYYGRTIAIKIMPVGVRVDRLLGGFQWPECQWRLGELRDQLAGKYVMVGMDDVDPFKGLNFKFEAFALFLEQHPEHRGKIVLLQVANPGRAASREGQQLREELRNLAAQINERFGSGSGAGAGSASAAGSAGGAAGAAAGQSEFGPCVLLERHVPLHERIALYHLADCAVVTAVRDGLNLSPHEYIVCRQGPIDQLLRESGGGSVGSGLSHGVGGGGSGSFRGGGGGSNSNMSLTSLSQSLSARELGQGGAKRHVANSTLIVSEFIGCSPSLSGAIRVNPFSIESVADAIHEAVSMPLHERQVRHRKHYDYVSRHTVGYWADSVVADLQRACARHAQLRCYNLGFGLGYRVVALNPNFRKLEVTDVVGPYQRAHTRAILLDYDGTLMPQSSIARGPTDDVTNVLLALCNDPANHVFIVSGRDRATLSAWFDHIPSLGLAAEHGFFCRWRADKPWERVPLQGRAGVTGDGVAEDSFVDSKAEAALGPATAGAAAAAAADGGAVGMEGLVVSGGRRASGGAASGGKRPEAGPGDDDSSLGGDGSGAGDGSERWRGVALPIMRQYTESTDGSFIEEKESALVWHHRDADPAFGSWQAKELMDHLESVLAGEHVAVAAGQGIVEVKPSAVGKGVVVERALEMIRRSPGALPQSAPEFVLCVGDDRSDEDMFVAAAEKTGHHTAVFDCTVGQKPSKATYYLNDTGEVIELLSALASLSLSSYD